MTRRYETIVIASPEMSEQDLDQLNTTIESIITDAGSQVLKSEPWGKQRLAYPINKQNEGHYVRYDLDAAPDAVAALERRLRLTDKVLRYQTVRYTRAHLVYQEKADKERAERLAREEERARERAAAEEAAAAEAEAKAAAAAAESESTTEAAAAPEGAGGEAAGTTEAESAPPATADASTETPEAGKDS